MTTSCICLPSRHCALTDQNIAETLPDLYRAQKLGDQRLATHTGCRPLAEPDNRDYRGYDQNVLIGHFRALLAPLVHQLAWPRCGLRTCRRRQAPASDCKTITILAAVSAGL